jgi:hypothetical protein
MSHPQQFLLDNRFLYDIPTLNLRVYFNLTHPRGIESATLVRNLVDFSNSGRGILLGGTYLTYSFRPTIKTDSGLGFKYVDFSQNQFYESSGADPGLVLSGIMTHPATALISGDATWSWWIKLNATSVGRFEAFLCAEADPTLGGICWVFKDNRLKLYEVFGDVPANATLLCDFTNVFSLDTLYNITVTRSGNDYSMYVDNVFKETITNSATFATPSINPFWGSISGGGDIATHNRWSGNLYKYAEYDRSVSASEISQIYNSGAGL